MREKINTNSQRPESFCEWRLEVMKRLKDQIAERPSTPPRDWQLEERLYLKRVKFQVFYKALPRTGYSSDSSSLHRLYSRCR